MKNYLKYDFAAIVGAEVTIVTHEGYEHVGQLVSTQLSPSDVEQLIIYLPEEDGCIVINADYVNTLTAKIKVEDMSVKQLRRLLKTYQAPGLEHIFVIAENGVHHSIMTTWEEVGKQDFADYIDCTDWGWYKN